MITPDQAVREQALDITRSFIVQAPAGSGKTELLIQRYLALLATVDEPEEVLAVTFTRKAVAEMRKRVIEALASAQGPKPQSPHAALTWQLAKQALQCSQTRQWNLPNQPARLKIMTIDALNGVLVRSMPLLSRLGTDAMLVENAQQLYEEAAWQALKRQAGAPALQTLLLHLDNNDRKVVQMLCRLLARRDQWLPHLVPLRGEGFSLAEKRERLTTMFQEVVDEELARAHADIPDDIGQQMVRIATAGANQLYAEGNVDKPHVCCRELKTLPAPEFDQAGAWKGLASLFLTANGDWRSARSFNRTLGFSPGHDLKPAIEQLQELLQGKEKLRKSINKLKDIPEVIYLDEQWSVLAALIDLLPLAVAELRLVFRQRGAVDFVEQSLAAIRSLGEADEVTDLAMKLDYRLQHILMDEFQDTSHSQFGLLEKLLDGWQPGDGRSLFLVGDPMQSIYGFREADVSGFLKVRDHGIAAIRPESLALSANFRSTPQLMDWFNKVFPDVLASEDNLSLGAVRYSQAVSAREAVTASEVTVHAALDRDVDTEGQQILQQIRTSLASDPDQSIGVLVRSRGHLHALYDCLVQHGIDFQAVDVLPLLKQPVIQDLLSVTQSLLHLHDRLAWLAILRAPWCGLTLASLHALILDRPHDDMWSLITSLEAQQRLDEEERVRLQRVISAYIQVIDHTGQLTLRTRVEWLWQALGGYECHADAQQDTETYLNLIDELEQGGQIVTVHALYTALQDVYSSTTTSLNANVQLMTIHKSKGLQFDTVILPALERSARSDSKELLVWHEELGDDYDKRLLLAPIHAPGSNDQSFDFVRQREQQRRSYEVQRLLYVATTRARNHLHLFASLDSNKEGEPGNPRAGSFLGLVYPHIQHEFSDAVSADPDDQGMQPETHNQVCLYRVPLDWQPGIIGSNISWQSDDSPIETRERIEFSWAGQIARVVGTVVHQYLHRISQEGILQWDQQRLKACRGAIETSLISAGLPGEALTLAADKVLAALANTLHSTKAQWLLSKHKNAQSEYAVSGVIDGVIVNRIIDRTFIDEEDTRWIIDYKTSSHEGGNIEGFLDEEQKRYQAQLNEYARLLGNISKQPQVIRTGLYFPLMDAWREVDVMGAVCLM